MADMGFPAAFFAYGKGDGLVLMANCQYSKALMLESKQYGWTEVPRESRFSNPWVIALICAAIVLISYSLFRVIGHRKLPLVSGGP